MCRGYVYNGIVRHKAIQGIVKNTHFQQGAKILKDKTQDIQQKTKQ